MEQQPSAKMPSMATEVSPIERINSLIIRGEDSSIEFKSSYSPDDLPTLVAFANGYDAVPLGTMLIGVDDSGEIIGLRGDVDSIQRRIADDCRSRCEPPVMPSIRIIKIGRKEIMSVEVARSQMRPHRAAGVCYVRVGSTTRKATVEEEQRIREETFRRPFDDITVEGARIEDLDFDKISRYYRATRSAKVVEGDKRDIGFLAVQLGLARDSGTDIHPTVAAILLFGRNAQRFFPLSSVNAIRFRGSNQADPISDRQEIKGTIDEVIENSWDFVKSRSSVSGIITESSVKRQEVREYPLVAVREAVANAVTHRDYSDPGSQIDVYMFDDRIEIRNPGGLAGGLTKDDLLKKTGKRYLRNPNIAGLLYELKFVEKAGTGVLRIFKDMEENGSPPPDYEVDANSVKIILPAHPDYAAQRKFEEGLLAKDRGEVSRARKLLQEALQLRPNFSEAMATLAALEGEVGPIEKARELYRSALDRDPRNIELCWIGRRLKPDRETIQRRENCTNVLIWWTHTIL